MTRKDNHVTKNCVVYVGDYKKEEEQHLRDIGVRTFRVPGTDAGLVVGLSKDERGSRAFVRSARLGLAEFTTLHAGLTGSGFAVVTSPRSFEMAGSFEAQHVLLRDMQPRAFVLPGTATSNEVLSAITQHKMALPIFVRSDVESAAKYVGIDGCVVKEASVADVERVLVNLRRHVQKFKTIVAKEMLPVATVRDGGPRMEYRAVGAQGHLVAFDFDSGKSPLPGPLDAGIVEPAEKALAALAIGGLDGAIFIDFAVLQNRRVIVVECKDFSNGTIGNIPEVAKAVLSFRD